MSKLRIIQKKSVHSIIAENTFLRKIHHPLTICMESSFQDRDNLFLVMENMKGGDLRFHIIKHRKFPEKVLKFWIACITLSLEYIHNENIIHWDIKPENLIFDSQGYLHITDFGIAKVWKPENKKDTSGTPGYMAPEIMARRNHSFSVDFYAMGVILFECIMGHRPYRGRTRKDIKR